MNFSVLLMVAVLEVHQASCEPKALLGYGWMTSARLEELADERVISEADAPAILILWAPEVCKIIANSEEQGNAPVHEPQECAEIVELKAVTGKTLAELASEKILGSKREVASLVWVKPNGKDQLVHHIVVASPDGAIKLVHPGYGRDGAVEPMCIVNPWFQNNGRVGSN